MIASVMPGGVCGAKRFFRVAERKCSAASYRTWTSGDDMLPPVLKDADLPAISRLEPA
jgi:hypothetical protein